MWARAIYNMALCLLLPFVAWRLKRRARSNPGYADRPQERFGHFEGARLPRSLWVHTVSVGEFIAARPFIDWLLATYPDWPVVVTTMTPTGADRVRAAYGDRVRHHYLPYDFSWSVGRLFGHLSPAVLVIMETELWPNLLATAARRAVPVIVANARLSERSARGYARVGPLTRDMLGHVSLIAAQAEPDGRRFVDLGLPAARLRVTGTVKYDLVIRDEDRAQARAWRDRWGRARPVWMAASTHPGEDEQVLEAFRLARAQRSDLLLVLVPRHPERFGPVADLLAAQGFTCVRHSTSAPVPADTAVVLGDTMGQMLPLLGASDVAFIGGSLVPVGGHNMLEPLAMGVPALCGPHVFNFAIVADHLVAQDVLRIVQSPGELAGAVLTLVDDEARRAALAARGVVVVEQQRGALARLCGLVADTLAEKGIRPRD
jgi:3-deoxy-D-manno-octulosonic-acid transferase